MKATWIPKKIDNDRFYGICGGFAHEGQYVFLKVLEGNFPFQEWFMVFVLMLPCMFH
jgi:hypothetical protein